MLNFSVRWQSPQSASVRPQVPRDSCGHPCLVSQNVERGARLQGVLGGGGGGGGVCSGPVPQGHSSEWEMFESVEVGEELTVSSSQSKDSDLRRSVQLVDAVLF